MNNLKTRLIGAAAIWIVIGVVAAGLLLSAVVLALAAKPLRKLMGDRG